MTRIAVVGATGLVGRTMLQVLIELATPDHRVITGQTVTFTVPATGAHGH